MKIKKNRCTLSCCANAIAVAVVVGVGVLGVEGRRQQHRAHTKFFATALHLY